MIIDDLKYREIFCKINDHSLIEVSGTQAESFLQGQLSNDLRALKSDRAQISCRLNLKGKIQSFFSLGRHQDRFYIFIDKDKAEFLLDELNQYLICEDVQFKTIREGQFITVVGAGSLSYSRDIPIYFIGFQGKILSFENKDNSFCSPEDLRKVYMYTGFPLWGKIVTEHDFINETILNKYAVSYHKGCFFGQEVPAKINSGRGGNYFPCLLNISEPLKDKAIEGQDIIADSGKAGVVFDTDHRTLYCKLKRSYRVWDKELLFEISGQGVTGRLVKFPSLGWMSDRELSQDIFLKGSHLYTQNNISEAIRLINLALKIDDKNADAYEALGVIYGHQERYDDAIKLMEILKQVAPNSVMAHTNLSLFYMKKGDTEKAEEEKAKATVLSMKLAGKEKKNQKEEESLLLKNIKMYQEVLVIDPKDFFAHFRLADVYMKKGDFKQVIYHAKKAISSQPKSSLSYLLLGKALEQLNQGKEALEIYREGASIAALQGDTSVANEISLRVNQLINA